MSQVAQMQSLSSAFQQTCVHICSSSAQGSSRSPLPACTFRSGFKQKVTSLQGRRVSAQCRRQHVLKTCAARNPLEEQIAQGNINVNLRSEAEAPWRSVRIVMFGFFCVSASVAAVIATSQVIGALGNASGALPLNDVATSLAVDLGSIAFFGYLLQRDLKARDKQIARLKREEKLGALQLELANRKRLRLSELRGFARVVLFAGTREQVQEVVKAAEPYREQLSERGVLLVPLSIYGDSVSDRPDIPALTNEDLKWRANPLRPNQWAEWFNEQLSVSSKSSEKGLYVGLRLDGRVRASGTGPPPWELFVRQLPKTEGVFKGFLDGMDGRVG